REPLPSLGAGLYVKPWALAALARAGPRGGRVGPLEQAAAQMFEVFRLQLDDAPPEHLLLAVRAGWPAAAENPDDPRGPFYLGRAYVLGTEHTLERFWQQALPRLRQLRHVQAVTALNNALLRADELPKAQVIDAHRYLFNLYARATLPDRT